MPNQIGSQYGGSPQTEVMPEQQRSGKAPMFSNILRAASTFMNPASPLLPYMNAASILMGGAGVQGQGQEGETQVQSGKQVAAPPQQEQSQYPGPGMENAYHQQLQQAGMLQQSPTMPAQPAPGVQIPTPQAPMSEQTGFATDINPYFQSSQQQNPDLSQVMMQLMGVVPPGMGGRRMG